MGLHCFFRDCAVSSRRHPNIHFFRFPFKNPSRMLKWVEMAKVPELMKLPDSVQKNKRVCARHFRDECFMNYMRNKLVSSAVPTLDRIKDGYAIDYAAVNGEKIIKLPQPKAHMIPPPEFECPLYLDELEQSLGHTPQEKPDDNVENDWVEIDLVDEEVVIEDQNPSIPKLSTYNKKMRPISSCTISSKKLKILNVTAADNETLDDKPDSLIGKFVEFADMTQEQQENALLSVDDCIEIVDELHSGSVIEATQECDADLGGTEVIETGTVVKTKEAIVHKAIEPTITKSQHESVCKAYEKLLEKERSEYTKTKEDTYKQIKHLVKALQEANCELEERKTQLNEIVPKLKATVEELSLKNADLESTVQALTLSYRLAKQRIDILNKEHSSGIKTREDLEAGHLAMKNLQQVFAVSTSKESLTNSTSSPAASGSLSKAQLFNCIKKYLSSSMVALVRMEMFGSAERQWKPDEKRASLDLLSLGERVYKYFTDEWRFRLPTFRQVQGWQLEASAEPDDDEDLKDL